MICVIFLISKHSLENNLKKWEEIVREELLLKPEEERGLPRLLDFDIHIGIPPWRETHEIRSIEELPLGRLSTLAALVCTIHTYWYRASNESFKFGPFCDICIVLNYSLSLYQLKLWKKKTNIGLHRSLENRRFVLSHSEETRSLFFLRALLRISWEIYNRAWTPLTTMYKTCY